ncbi:MAG: DUF192 domain-containing protein [Actinomycetota bacterium]|nr:DUF192 domain-containing protein [Actinomycetota bacterium]
MRDTDVLASVEVLTSLRDRTRGLLGRDELAGAVVLRPAKSVHTIGMRFPIDVAYCDRELVVLKTVTMATYRVGAPVLRAHAVVEAEAGSFERWKLEVGDQLEIRGDGDGPADRDGPADGDRDV